MTAAQINEDGTIIDGRFSGDPWTTDNGRLPGLFGETVEIPERLRISVTVSYSIRTPSFSRIGSVFLLK
jgi:hypothetical protein